MTLLAHASRPLPPLPRILILDYHDSCASRLPAYRTKLPTDVCVSLSNHRDPLRRDRYAQPPHPPRACMGRRSGPHAGRRRRGGCVDVVRPHEKVINEDRALNADANRHAGTSAALRWTAWMASSSPPALGGLTIRRYVVFRLNHLSTVPLTVAAAMHTCRTFSTASTCYAAHACPSSACVSGCKRSAWRMAGTWVVRLNSNVRQC